jgi:hypothetical protein
MGKRLLGRPHPGKRPKTGKGPGRGGQTKKRPPPPPPDCGGASLRKRRPDASARAETTGAGEEMHARAREPKARTHRAKHSLGEEGARASQRAGPSSLARFSIIVTGHPASLNRDTPLRRQRIARQRAVALVIMMP